MDKMKERMNGITLHIYLSFCSFGLKTDSAAGDDPATEQRGDLDIGQNLPCFIFRPAVDYLCNQ
jgi:hypothetical protein